MGEFPHHPEVHVPGLDLERRDNERDALVRGAGTAARVGLDAGRELVQPPGQTLLVRVDDHDETEVPLVLLRAQRVDLGSQPLEHAARVDALLEADTPVARVLLEEATQEAVVHPVLVQDDEPHLRTRHASLAP
ncbi:hypothetical protein [Sorangium sp. So ce513]|uniref:hypothetical protein n=1 Tax=Sorangium sp. So ce513 TaxID=3133315 RepID=UPI003F5FBBF8